MQRTKETAKTNLYKLVQHTIASHEPVIVTGKTGNVVILSLKDYKALQETLYILQTMPSISNEAKKAKTTKNGDLYGKDKLTW